MLTEEEERKQVFRVFQGGFKGLIDACKPLKEVFPPKITFWSILPALVFAIILFLLNTTNPVLLKILGDVVNNGLAILGVLIGVGLGGFILIVSFGSQGLIDLSVKRQLEDFREVEKLEHSYIQKSTAKYAFIVLMLFAIFITLLIIFLVIEFDIEASKKVSMSMNYIGIILSTGLLIYGIVLTLQLVLNIFTLGQTSTLELFMKKKDEKDKPKSDSLT